MLIGRYTTAIATVAIRQRLSLSFLNQALRIYRHADRVVVPLLSAVLFYCALPVKAIAQVDNPPEELSSLAEEQALKFPEGSCLEQLDATVALASNEPENTTFLAARFNRLEQQCPQLPQIAHNLGVIHARAGQWPQAIDHFQRSVDKDPRAAMTLRHLQQIFEHRAAQAYALALNTPVESPPPRFYFQRSDHQNVSAIGAARQTTALHSISTLEYEMFAWWQALHNSIGLDAHYVDEFPDAAIKLSQQRYARQEWANMHREIAFTAEDAVVVLSDAYHNRTLFLLRLVGTRWKIYQETPL